MSEVFDRIIGHSAGDGRRRHAGWDAGLFDRLARGPGASLWGRLEGQPHAEATLEAYAALLVEAVGSGYLDQVGDDHEPGRLPNFLAFALLELAPEALAAEPAAQRVGHLAALWNLGEGLLSGPAWLDRYALACAGRLRRVGGAGEFLVEVLGPALAPAEPAAWSGPFAVAVLDARPVLEDFLPGEMYLAAPRVVCIADRRDPAHHVGLLLGHDGGSRLLGTSPPLARYVEEGLPPAATVSGGLARVGSHRVELSMLEEPHRVAAARAGFMVVSAVDSQRLWIVETP